MKKLLLLIIISFCLSAQAATNLIIAEMKSDDAGAYVDVRIWGKSDGSYIESKVTESDFLTKLSALTDKSITGFAKNTDRILIWFNADGTINRIDCHVIAKNDTESFQATTISKESLPSKTITDIGTMKTATEELPSHE